MAEASRLLHQAHDTTAPLRARTIERDDTTNRPAHCEPSPSGAVFLYRQIPSCHALLRSITAKVTAKHFSISARAPRSSDRYKNRSLTRENRDPAPQAGEEQEERRKEKKKTAAWNYKRDDRHDICSALSTHFGMGSKRTIRFLDFITFSSHQ